MDNTLIKIILVGDSFVGKTSLLKRYTDSEFNNNYVNTIGVDFKNKSMRIKNKNIKLQIWDTAGQERFRSMTNAYYRGSHIAILIFDLTKISTFNNLQKWISEMKQFISDNCQIVLIGNKVDCESKIEVSQDKIDNFIDDHNIYYYFSTSAKTNQSVDDAFNKIIEYVIDIQNKTENKFSEKDQLIKHNKSDKSNNICYC